MSKARLIGKMKFRGRAGIEVMINGWPLYEAVTLAAIALDDEEVASAIAELQKIQRIRAAKEVPK